MKKRTLKDLWKYAEENLGMPEQLASQVLKNNGVSNKFDPQEWDRYIAILGNHSKKLHEALKKVEPAPALIEKCPVCGAPVETTFIERRVFLVRYRRDPVWRCTRDTSHYHQQYWYPLFQKTGRGSQRQDTT